MVKKERILDLIAESEVTLFADSMDINILRLPSTSEKTSKCILVAEDIQEIRIVTVALLESCGYHVDSAVDGLEALRKLGREKYDLVLLDCHMPNMSGVECMERILAQHSDRPVVIAYTGQEEAREVCLNAGMDDFLVKPAPSEVLIGTVARWIDR